jgi:hypothetical protein
VSRVLHICCVTLGLGQSSACCEMDIAAWLGEYYTDSDGSEVSLPDKVKEVLLTAFNDDVLDEKQDILDDAVDLPPKRMKQLVEIFQIAYKDVTPPAEQKLMHLARIDRWLRARFSEDEDGTSSVLDGKGKDKPSEAESKDLTAQGLTQPRQMRILELSLYLGRPVGDSELEGGSYKSPAATFKGSTLAKKGGDLVTLDMVIKQTLVDGKREPLEDWFTELLQLMGEDTTTEMKDVSARISLFWNQVRSDFKSPKMVARYLQLYRKRYQGRGIPVLADDNLRSAVFSALLAEKEEAPQPPTAPASLSSLSSYSGSTTSGSSIASSAAAAANEASAKMMAALDKLVVGQTEMKEVQTKLNQKVLAIERTLNSASENRCFLCNESGHKKENCPNKDKFTRSGKPKSAESES